MSSSAEQSNATHPEGKESGAANTITRAEEPEPEASNATTRAEERLRWERTVRELEEEVSARRQQFAGAQELLQSQEACWAKEIEHEELACELAAVEAGTPRSEMELATAAIEWQTSAKAAVEAVQRLELLANKELIRTERLRGCALVQQARCSDLERRLETETASVQKLQAQISTLVQQAAWRQQEAQQDQSMSVLRRQGLDRELEAMRWQLEETEAETEARRREASARRDRATKQFRAQLERQEAKVLCGSGSPRSQHSTSSTVQPGRRSSYGSSGTSKQAPQVAALRTAIYRQEQDAKRELQDLRAEVSAARHELEAERGPWLYDRGRLELRLAEALGALSIEQASVTTAETERMDQGATLRSLEEGLETQPRTLLLKLVALGVDPALVLSTPRGDATRASQGAGPMPAKGSSSPSQSCSDASVAEDAFVPAPVQALRPALEQASASNRGLVQALQEQEAVAEKCRLEAVQHTNLISKLREDLVDEHCLEARCVQQMRTAQEELGAACRRQEAGVEQALRTLRQLQLRLQEDQATAHEYEFLELSFEADEAEHAYLRLRSALVAECEQEERLHAELLAQQAEQRQSLVKEFALAGMELPEQLPELSSPATPLENDELVGWALQLPNTPSTPQLSQLNSRRPSVGR